MEVNKETQGKVEQFFEERGCFIEGWNKDKEGNPVAVVDLCPCEKQHTISSSRPVWVYFSPYVSIRCFHKSCKDNLWSLSKELWSYINKI